MFFKKSLTIFTSKRLFYFDNNTFKIKIKVEFV